MNERAPELDETCTYCGAKPNEACTHARSRAYQPTTEHAAFHRERVKAAEDRARDLSNEGHG